jgi:hypothetical protein
MLKPIAQRPKAGRLQIKKQASSRPGLSSFGEETEKIILRDDFPGLFSKSEL